jgi:radical SAM superfamily enzyme YgiQ (UPF0313 family)
MHIKLISPGSIMYRKEGGIFPRLLRYAPLTLSTLAALVPKELNAKITLHDEIAKKIDYNDRPDIVAISAITGTANRAYAIADYYRRNGVTVVIGGVHASLLPQEAKKHADAIITGMAFDSWPKLLRDFKMGIMQEHYDQANDMNFSKLPMPRRDLLPKLSYISKNSIQATFGCPYKCDFCAVISTQKKYLRRPIEDVIKELSEMNSRFVTFIDPSPMEDKKYIKQLMREMIPLKKIWGGLATVKIGDDEELLDLAAQSGCKGLLIGFETIDQEALNEVNKGFSDVEKYKEVCKKLHDRGISINGTFIFGMDSHKKDIFKKTVDFVQENAIELPRYAIYTPFPGTGAFTKLNNENRILTKNWSLYDVQHVVFKPKQMTTDELFEGSVWAWEQTYNIKNIKNRITKAGTNIPLSLVTNLGYRYYGNRLRNFPNHTIIELEKQWNSKLL